MIRAIALSALAAIGIAQRPATLQGRWAGESRCVGNRPSCHNEHVIYRIDSTGTAALVMHGFRTAGTDTVDMGDLDCRRQGGAAMTCAIRQGTWRFWIAQDSLRGSLTESDGSISRQVVATRQH